MFAETFYLPSVLMGLQRFRVPTYSAAEQKMCHKIYSAADTKKHPQIGTRHSPSERTWQKPITSALQIPITSIKRKRLNTIAYVNFFIANRMQPKRAQTISLLFSIVSQRSRERCVLKFKCVPSLYNELPNAIHFDAPQSTKDTSHEAFGKTSRRHFSVRVARRNRHIRTDNHRQS
ncbi:MAG: hypothetical protein ABL996_11110 [Micropepsaceae bacterium]